MSITAESILIPLLYHAHARKVNGQFFVIQNLWGLGKEGGQAGYLTHNNLNSAVYQNKQLVFESSNQNLDMQLEEVGLW